MARINDLQLLEWEQESGERRCRSQSCGCSRCRHPHGESAWESEWEQPLPCPSPTSVTVSNFPRYRNAVASLPPSERAKLRSIADLIKRSFRPSCRPIRTVTLVGHADRDVVRERAQPGFMVRISRERAMAVKQGLEQLIGNRGISSRLAWNICGAGSSRLVVQNPSTEQARMRNRRVEIVLSSTQPALARTSRESSLRSLIPAGNLVPGFFCQLSPTSSCLTNFPVPTAALGKPVRTLTKTEARDIVVHLVNQGILTLRDPPQFDSSCRLTRPRPTDLVILDPPFIDQVEFVGDSPGAKRGRAMTDLDMRMVVLLFYFSRMLRTTWGVTEIHHLGIGSFGTHVGRLAMDFSGVGGTINNSSLPSFNGPFQLNVQTDWGDKPVVLPNGTQAPRWPNVVKGRPFNDTLYRLDPQQNPFANQTTPQSFLAMAIFRDVYNFATLHCTDTKPPGPPTTIGKSSRFIIHPDHTSPVLRGAHQNHIHMEIPL